MLSGWTASARGRADATVNLTADGSTFAVASRRLLREDVAATLKADPQELFGFEILLPPNIWRKDGSAASLSVSCGGRSLPLRRPTSLAETTLEILDLPASWGKERQIRRLILHLQAMGAYEVLSQELRSRVEDAFYERHGVREATRIHLSADEPCVVKGHVDGIRGLTIFGWALGANPGKESLWLKHRDRTIHVRSRRLYRPDVSSHFATQGVNLGFELDVPASLWSELDTPRGSLDLEVLADLQPLDSLKPIQVSVAQLESALEQLPTIDCAQLQAQSIEARLRHLLVVGHCFRLQDLQLLPQSSAVRLALQALALRLPLGAQTPPHFATPQEVCAEVPPVWATLSSLNDLLSGTVSPEHALDCAWEQMHNAGLQQDFLKAVTPWACTQGLFDWIACRIHVPTWKGLISQPSPWGLSLALVWLTHSQKPKLALEVSDRLVNLPDTGDWLNTECVAHSVSLLAKLGGERISQRPGWLGTLVNLSRLVCRSSSSVWGRGHDLHLTNAAASLLKLSTELPPSAELQQEWLLLVDAQSFNPSFWEALKPGHSPLPSWLDARYQLFCAWRSAFITATRPSIQDQFALAELIKRGSNEAQRWQTEWLCFSKQELPCDPVLAVLPPAEYLRDCYSRSAQGAPSASLSKTIAAVLPAHPICTATQAPPDLCIVFTQLQPYDDPPPQGLLHRLQQAGLQWLIASNGPRTEQVDARHITLSLDGQPASHAALWCATLRWFSIQHSRTAIGLFPTSANLQINELLEHNPSQFPYIGQTDYWTPSPIESIAAIDRLTDSNNLFPDPCGCILSPELIRTLIEVLLTPQGLAIYSAGHEPDRLIRDLLKIKDVSAAPHSPRLIHPRLVALLDEAHSNQVNQHMWIWPTEAPPSLSSPARDNTLELLSPKENLTIIEDSKIIVIVVIRNEMTLLPHFYDHYRSLGADCFIFIDNKSTDGSAAYLSGQSRTIVYSAESEYKNSHYGVSWQRTVLAHHCIGKWVIIADADEFLMYPDFENILLPEWIQKLEAHGQTAAMTVQIDMYPSPPLSAADFRKQVPFKAAKWLDSPPIRTWRLGSGHYSNSDTYLSSLRHRIVRNAPPNAFTAQKIAVFRYMPWIHFSEGLHYASNLYPGPQMAYFAHFKYHKEFGTKVLTETLREQHFGNASEYQEYSKWLADFEDDSLWPETRIEFINSSSLKLM